MADARFESLWVPIPFLLIPLLFVYLMSFIIRVGMAGAPKYQRKCVRYPINQGYAFPDPPTSYNHYKSDTRRNAYDNTHRRNMQGSASAVPGRMYEKRYVPSPYTDANLYHD